MIGSVTEVASALIASRKTVAFTGAGISVESGIPLFRGKNGLLTKYGPPKTDSYRQFLRDPDTWWANEIKRKLDPWIIDLREAVGQASPNFGHKALVELEALGLVQTIITQNLDGLHQEAGSADVVEIHGSRFKFRCIECGAQTPRKELYAHRAPPPCSECGGRVKYDTVLFGEPIPPIVLESARRLAEQADCMLVIGTSSKVRPAGGLPRIARANGALLVEINPVETALSKVCNFVLRAPAGAVLPLLAKICSSTVSNI